MRKIVSTLLFAFTVHQAQAQQDYKDLIAKTVNTLDTAQDQAQKLDQSNRLSLIAKKWDKEWVTHYYAAFGKTMISYNEKDADKRDAYLDEADQELEDAIKTLGKPTDETYVLAAMIANARLAVKPKERYMQYGKIFSEDLEKAKELNPDNPRIYFLQGIAKYHTPKMFGGGKKAAKPYLEKADGLFAKQTTDDVAKPYWGAKTNTYLLAQCNNTADDK